MNLGADRFYQASVIAGVLSILGFLSYLLIPPSLWTMMGLLGFGGVFLVIALVLFYVGDRFEGRHGSEGL
ncbi:hypothetical protein C9439_05050 [archaeon SCG-AAA382B04]|nr:hypothetical protein C9439_05050 [archaeon SCG-AAA382B04]